jgi:nucleotide-binding universal stress UspA family protein
MSASMVAAYCPSRSDRAPVDFAVAASRATGAGLVIVSVVAGGGVLERLHGGEPSVAAGDASGTESAAVEALAAELRAAGVAAAARVIEHTTAARGLAHVVAELRPTLLVLGSAHHSDRGRVRPGSTAERLVAGSSCPVAVVPREHVLPEGGLRTVGAAFVPTPEGREALHAAAELARALGASLRVIIVLDPSHAGEQSPGLMAGQHRDTEAAEAIAGRHRIEAREAAQAAIAELAGGLDVDLDVLYQEPAEGLEAASHNLDLLVMGSRAYGPLKAVMLGGVSRKVVTRAACPVLVLPRGTEAAAESLLAAVDSEASI